MGGYVGYTRKFIKCPHPQGFIYDSNYKVIVGVLLGDLVLGKMMTWDMEHMLDIENLMPMQIGNKVSPNWHPSII